MVGYRRKYYHPILERAARGAVSLGAAEKALGSYPELVGLITMARCGRWKRWGQKRVRNGLRPANLVDYPAEWMYCQRAFFLPTDFMNQAWRRCPTEHGLLANVHLFLLPVLLATTTKIVAVQHLSQAASCRIGFTVSRHSFIPH